MCTQTYLLSQRVGLVCTVAPLVKNSGIFIYSGHSSDGEYFNPDYLFYPGAVFAPEYYQVFFFNACTTYSYFHTNYFNRKAESGTDDNGTAYLDVVTNAIGANFRDLSVSFKERPTASIALLTSLLGLKPNGKRFKRLPSWQTILSDIATGAGYQDTALTSVRLDGSRLPTAQEWHAASVGTPDDSTNCNTDAAGAENTGSRTNCVSDFGVHDMVGNLAEWADFRTDLDASGVLSASDIRVEDGPEAGSWLGASASDYEFLG